MGNKERFYMDIMAAQQEVTGSCYLCVARLPNDERIRFAIDFGLFQEEPYREYNKELLFHPEQLDFVVVTHCHTDHIGRVPMLFAKGYRGHIYATQDTCTLLPVSMEDNYKIERKDAQRNNRKALYEEDDVQMAKQSLYPCQYNVTYALHPHVNVLFLMNGHLPGAASIEMEVHYPGYESIFVDITGDYKPTNTFFEVSPIPEEIRKRRVISITEATYGDEDTVDVKSTFVPVMKKALQEKKTIVLLVYSLGRAQDILYTLRCMQQEGTLDASIPIGYDGNLSKTYTHLYQSGALHIREEMRDFLPQNVQWLDSKTRELFMEQEDTKIIVTTSGNGSFGPAQQYLTYYVPKKDAIIVFTGFTPEGSIGAELLQAKEEEIVKVGGILLPKEADIAYTAEFSAHAKADELVARLQQFPNRCLVLVTHGPAEAEELLAKRIIREVHPKMTAILNRSYFYRVNPYGLVKMLPTKFQ